MNAKKEYQKPLTETIELQIETPIAASVTSLNYGSDSQRTQDNVNSYWSSSNPFKEE